MDWTIGEECLLAELAPLMIALREWASNDARTLPVTSVYQDRLKTSDCIAEQTNSLEESGSLTADIVRL
jgi:hypothetical protein